MGSENHVFQGPRLKNHKRTSLTYLLAHVSLYSIALLLLSFLLLEFEPITAVYYFAVDFILHGLVDFVTGKTKAKFGGNNENVIFSISAVDQIVHIALMMITYIYLATGSFKLPGIIE